MIQSLLNPTGITKGKGGTLEFPSTGDPSGGSTYAFGSTINIGPVGAHFYPANIILRGTGAQDRSAPLLQMTDSTQDFFVINNHSDATGAPGNNNIAGVVFQDMIISFAVNPLVSAVGETTTPRSLTCKGRRKVVLRVSIQQGSTPRAFDAPALYRRGEAAHSRRVRSNEHA